MIPIISTLSYFSCEQMQQSQNEKGIMILKNQSSNISQITILGWYRLIGKSNQNYLLAQSRNNIAQNVIRIVYNPVKMQIYCSIFEVDLSPKDISQELKAYLQDKWFFIRIGMNLQDKIINKSYVYYTIIYENENYITQSLIKTSQFNVFDNNNFEYFYGSTSYYPFNRSCAVTKQILAFLGFSNDSSQGPFLEMSKFEMSILPKLYLHFDFFMASSSVLYNLSDNFKMCQKNFDYQSSIYFPYFQFKYESALYLRSLLDFHESQGIILKFDLLIQSFDSGQENIIVNIFSDQYDYQIQKDIYYNWYEIQMSNKSPSISDYFIDENLKHHQGFYHVYELNRFFYIDGILISTYSLNYKSIPKKVGIGFINTSYNNMSTQRKILIGSWKVFQGGFIQQCDDCILKIDDQECLQCANSSDYLEEGKNYSCKSSCNFPFQIIGQNTCSFIPNQGLCDQITGSDRFFSDQCSCPKGQYLDKKQKICLNCLQYCTTCENAYSCDIYNSFGYDGNCDKDSFNNGIQCVSKFLKIVNRLNKAFQINLKNIQCQKNSQYPEIFYQIQDDALKLGHSSHSFFFTLNFNLQISDFQIDDVYSICYLKNNDQHIFSIISKVNSQKQLELQIIDSDQSIILKAHIEAKTDIWIGFYYDYQGINLLVKYLYEQNSFYSSDIKNIIKYNLENPYLVFGIQSPLYLDQFPLCGNIGTNNWIIMGDLSMRYFINILFSFSEDDLISIDVFNFVDYKDNFQNNDPFIVNKIDPLVNFSVLPFQLKGDFQFNFLKGFQFKSNRGIVNLNKKLNKVPFVIKLSITANDFFPCFQCKYLVFSLVNQNNLVFTVRLQSCYLDYLYNLEICSSDVIKVQYLKYSDQLTLIRFSIILNYVQDEFDLEIPQELFVIHPQFYNIQLGGTCLGQRDPIIYYSRLEVYTGGFYYVNYDNQDPCFVYINRQNLTCILPKQGYALNKDGVVVLATDCNQNIKQNQPLYYYNEYTMMCQNSGIVLPNCRNLNISDLTCIECTDSQMILSKNCSCPDGMFLNQFSLTCQRCSAICKTCSDQNHCQECKGQNLIPPLCYCVQQNYYLDTNLNCQKCSQQCNTCAQNQNYCLTCSQGRINPPFCYCNPDLYQNNVSDSILNQCLPKNCPFKCLTCDSNNQCIQCRGDRVFPPYCVCSQNYYDDLLNQKELCQKCNQGYYFDEQLQKCVRFQVYIKRIYYYIEARFEIQFSSNQYQIKVYFDQEINQLENIINQKHVDNLFELHISQVNSTYFQFLNFTVSENNQKLTLYFELIQNIQQTTAYFLFKQTKIFQNSQYGYVLHPVYGQQPYSFNIGPCFLETTKQNVIGDIPTNRQIDSIISQFQILFYILNSIQPTSMFILLNIQIPPNLYQFLQKFAKRVYRNAPEKQFDIIKNQYNLFWIELNDEVSSAKQDKLKNFGFSDSILVNCQMILLKYAFIFFLIWIIKCLLIKFKIQKLKTLLDILIKRISIENEVNLLMLTLSICIQFQEVDSSNQFKRWSFYTATFMMIFFLYSNYWYYSTYNSEYFEKNKNKLEIFYLSLKCDKNQSYLAKNIYFLYGIKKISIILFIIILEKYPKKICILSCILNIFTAFLTGYLRPFQYLCISVIKVIGDILLSTTWILMILIIDFNSQISSNVVLDSSDVNYYLILGYSASIVLTVFNGIFFIKLILETVIIPIFEKIKANQQKKKEKLIYL
ncbi:hypothetical protein ABPG73_021065 [Tetrahymena malaccensis]